MKRFLPPVVSGIALTVIVASGWVFSTYQKSNQSSATPEAQLISDNPNSVEVGMNLDGISYWGPSYKFANVFLNAFTSGNKFTKSVDGIWRNVSESDDRPIETTANGWPILADAQRVTTTVFLQNNEQYYPTGRYVLTYEGSGQIVISNDVENETRTSGRIEFDATHGGTRISVDLIGPSDPENGGIQNIKLWAPGTEGQTAILHPDYQQLLQGFSVLRFMDWNRTNHSAQTNWSDRTPPDYASYGGPDRTVPYEHMVDISNAIGADPWITVPHLATDDYMQQLATLVDQRLATGRKVYIEYSNELWNANFSQTQWAWSEGCERTDTFVPFSTGNDWGVIGCDDAQSAANLIVSRASSLYQIFKTTLGDNRVVAVLGGQAGGPANAQRYLTTFGDSRFNPAQVYPDAVAIAPYFRTERESTATTVDAVAAELMLYLDQIDDRISRHRDLVDQFSQLYGHAIKLVAYEGGQGLVHKDDPAFKTAYESVQTDPRMYEAYKKLFESWKKYDGDVFVVFNLVEEQSQYGSWGHLETYDQAAQNPPKWRALQEAMSGDMFSQSTSCGNGTVEAAEECDDSNQNTDDGCSLCRISAGYVCTGEPSICTRENPPGDSGLLTRIVDLGNDMGFGSNGYRNKLPSEQFTDRSIDINSDGETDFSSGWYYSESAPLSASATGTADRDGTVLYSQTYNDEADSSRFYGGIIGEYTWGSHNPSEGFMNQNHASRDDYNFMSLLDGGVENQDEHRAAAFYFWKKDDFLNGGDANRVSFEPGGHITVHVSRYFHGFDYLRWVVRMGDQFYLSEDKFVNTVLEPSTEPDRGAFTSHTLDPTTTRWAVYNPVEPYSIFFSEESANWQDIDFTDVTAVGFYVHRNLRPSFNVDTDHLETRGGAIHALKWHSFESKATVHRSSNSGYHVPMAAIPGGSVGQVSLDPFYLSETEIPYATWRRVYQWAASNQYAFDLPDNGTYVFSQDGDMGSMDLLNGSYDGMHPVTDISFADAVIWSNALSELEGFRPVYYEDAALTVPLRRAIDREGTPIPGSQPTIYSQPDRSWLPTIYIDPSSTGYRLPTNAEWTLAYQDGAANYGWTQANSGGRTHVVGESAATSAGIADLNGNVWEYVWDKPARTQNLSAASSIAVYGGSFTGLQAPSTSLRLFGSYPLKGSSQIGFRVARGAQSVAVENNTLANVPVWQIATDQQLPGSVTSIPPVTPQLVRVPDIGADIPICSYIAQINKAPADVQAAEGSTIGRSGYDLYVGATEISFRDWVTVRDWGEANGYDFDHDGDMGSMDHEAGQHLHSPDDPVTDISLIDALVWTNALSEMNGRTPLYYEDGAFTQPYRATPTLRQRMFTGQGYHPQYSGQLPIFLDPSANGYRLPVIDQTDTTNEINEWDGFAGDNPSSSTEWYRDTAEGFAHPVGSKNQNELGIYDAYANVAEHTWGRIKQQYGMPIAGSWFYGDLLFADRYWTSRKEDHTVGWPYIGLRVVSEFDISAGPAVCGNGVFEPGQGESCGECPADCSYSVDGEAGNAVTFSQATIVSEPDTDFKQLAIADSFRAESSGYFAIDPDATYVVSGRFKSSGVKNSKVSLSLNTYSAGRQFVSNISSSIINQLVPTSWTMFVSSPIRGADITDNAAFVRLVLEENQAGNNVSLLFDDVTIRSVTDITTCQTESGIVSGNGTTNDSPAFQACVNSLPDGSTLFVPANTTLLLNDAIFFGNHVSLLGENNRTSTLKLDRALATGTIRQGGKYAIDADLYGFWLNFGIHGRFLDYTEAGLPFSEAYQKASGTFYSGEISHLNFVLTDKVNTYRAINFHSASGFTVQHNYMDGTGMDPYANNDEYHTSWVNQQVVGSATGYISRNASKHNGVIRQNEMYLNHNWKGNEQIGFGENAHNMIALENYMYGSGDDCLGVHQTDGFKILRNTCITVDGRYLIGSGRNGIIKGNYHERIPNPDGSWAIFGDAIETHPEDYVNFTPPENILITENTIVAPPGSAHSFGIRIRGGSGITITHNVLDTYVASYRPNGIGTPVPRAADNTFDAIRIDMYGEARVTQELADDPTLKSRLEAQGIVFGPSPYEDKILAGNITIEDNIVRGHNGVIAKINMTGKLASPIFVRNNTANGYDFSHHPEMVEESNNTVIATPVCGNDIIEYGEDCDSTSPECIDCQIMAGDNVTSVYSCPLPQSYWNAE